MTLLVKLNVVILYSLDGSTSSRLVHASVAMNNNSPTEAEAEAKCVAEKRCSRCKHMEL